MKKENIDLKRRIKEVESIKVPTERLKTFEPLVEGMGEVKREVIEEVLAMVSEFMDALEQVFNEEQKLKNIVTMRVSLLRMLEFAKSVIEEFHMHPDLSDDDLVFCNDYWFYLNSIQQIVVRF